MNAVEIILLAGNVVVGLPMVVLAVEVGAAVLWRGGKRTPEGDAGGGSVAVLIPAHDEEGQIAATVRSVRSQLREGDRVLVVADNCRDGTAEEAIAAGAEVLERSNATERGKGFALAAGVERLADQAADAIIVVDADTPLSTGAVPVLKARAIEGGRPIQALYLLAPGSDHSVKGAISAFAFAMKNHVRALGAERLGIPCLLRGTGMAFPWTVIAEAKLATGNIVEDMQLGIDLALAGHSPRFCPDAKVTGTLPESASAASTQRTRWEHGHLRTILHNVPRLIWAGVCQCRPSLIGLALDLAVPPLALLVCLWFLVAAAAAIAWAVGLCSAVPVYAAMMSAVLIALSIFAGWARFGRDLLPFATLLAVPWYIAWKVPLYLVFLVRPQSAWVRTARN